MTTYYGENPQLEHNIDEMFDKIHKWLNEQGYYEVSDYLCDNNKEIRDMIYWRK